MNVPEHKKFKHNPENYNFKITFSFLFFDNQTQQKYQGTSYSINFKIQNPVPLYKIPMI